MARFLRLIAEDGSKIPVAAASGYGFLFINRFVMPCFVRAGEGLALKIWSGKPLG